MTKKDLIVNAFFLLLLALLGGAATLLAWYVCTAAATRRWKQQGSEEIQQARDKARVEAIEAGLLEWLTMLELPQLEDQTKRQEAARQLRIVLVEKLMRGPRVR